MLNTRLAAAESMTHDVIRDLLGVKLDMNNFAVSVTLYITLQAFQSIDIFLICVHFALSFHRTW